MAFIKWLIPLNHTKYSVPTFLKEINSYARIHFWWHLSKRKVIVQVTPCSINQQLSWTKRMQRTSAEASPTLGYIKCKMELGPLHLRQLSYKRYVRIELECAGAICTSNKLYLISPSEVIHNRAALFIAFSYSRDSSITALKKSLALFLLVPNV